MRPSPQLLDRLSRARLLPRRAGASVGTGERRSKMKGSGMEFADHRSYVPGDDLKHLDPHLYARFGEAYVRQYEVHRQLPVSILVDRSRSMEAGEGQRSRTATELAGLLAFVALAGGDRVRLGATREAETEWSPWLGGVLRADAAFEWLERPRPAGGPFAPALASAAREANGSGLWIIISDFWDLPDRPAALFAALAEEVWCVHALLPEEADPTRIGEGDSRLVDAETGEELDLMIDREVLHRFARSVAAWRDDVRRAAEGSGGRYLTHVAGESVADTLLRHWRDKGALT